MPLPRGSMPIPLERAARWPPRRMALALPRRIGRPSRRRGVRNTNAKRGRSRAGAAGVIALFLVSSVLPLLLLTYSSVHLASQAVRKEVEARLQSSTALTAVAVQKEMDGLSDL